MNRDATTGIFQAHRSVLLNIAYRMLGSYAEAEDVVQDAWLRMHAHQQTIDSPKPWLVRTVTRLCLDVLKSARVQRETYIGPWLPEPTPTHEGTPLGDAVELADSLSMALMTLLERLSPVERATFILRETFDFSYREIAEILKLEEDNCRQIAHRARARVHRDRPNYTVEPKEKENLLLRFGEAASKGDMEGLLQLFHQGITLWNDGGGKVKASLKPIYGPAKVARFFKGIKDKVPKNLRYAIRQINGEPALVYTQGENVFSVIALDISQGQIRGVLMVVNPEKLHQIQREASEDLPVVEGNSKTKT